MKQKTLFVAATAAEAKAAGAIDWQAQAEAYKARVEELERLINSPEVQNWVLGAQLEAAHQVERWGVDHDAGKTPWDWFWLIGYLSQKAAAAQVAGDSVKARHHTISTAAALLNWHRYLSGADKRMRPGIATPAGEA